MAMQIVHVALIVLDWASFVVSLLLLGYGLRLMQETQEDLKRAIKQRDEIVARTSESKGSPHVNATV